MTLKEICKGLEGLGYPVAYRAFAEGEVPDPPYIVYYEQGTDNFSADGIPYDIITDLDIELYTKKKDPEAEQKIIDWLTENGILQGNGQGDLLLDQPLTRRQFAVLEYRIARLEGFV